jgi:hypothetical protein
VIIKIKIYERATQQKKVKTKTKTTTKMKKKKKKKILIISTLKSKETTLEDPKPINNTNNHKYKHHKNRQWTKEGISNVLLADIGESV